MPYRVFKSPDGRVWKVWDVPGSAGEGRLELRDGTYRNGWLCFECEGDKRRLVPVPDRWAERSEEQLWLYCRVATPVSPSAQVATDRSLS